MWVLFLDDERDPVRADAVVCRTSHEALREIERRGCPAEMNLDHDLGPGDDAQIFANGVIDMALDGDLVFPEDFRVFVHSQNPVGADLLLHKITSIVDEMRSRSASPSP